MENDKNFEVIIIGGSYAGLSAAMALGRSLRKVLVIDGGKPCNSQTPHSHNFITQDGKTPASIARTAKDQVLNYKSVNFINDFAVKGEKRDNDFSISVESGDAFYGKKIIFATGIKDIMPDIKGFSDCWGISVIHCPYCHGYEFRGQKTGIMVDGDQAFHLASLVNNLTDQVTVLTQGKSEFTAEQSKILTNRNIKVVDNRIKEIKHQEGNVTSVVFENGQEESFSAIYASLPFVQHSDIPLSLGCELTDLGYIHIKDFQKTTIDGVYVCGDNSTTIRSVANAVYSGNMAGVAANMELAQERFLDNKKNGSFK